VLCVYLVFAADIEVFGDLTLLGWSLCSVGIIKGAVFDASDISIRASRALLRTLSHLVFGLIDATVACNRPSQLTLKYCTRCT
jgi:hypothetical protein